MLEDPLTRVREALEALGLAHERVELQASGKTARQAAQALGVPLEQIVKSLVFTVDARPVLVLVAGHHRVDPERFAQTVGAREARPAAPEVVAAVTGFPTGAVPPVGLREPLPVYMDRALLAQPMVWASAGTPRHMMRLDPKALSRALGAVVLEVA
ncbi:aminoacyl-tRNA deacylase [Marinithermus hydrothermalis]|uniref:YbaK/prolyl-tRNA synthetase associated region n=1 Tax=Marinithermus hydrothermalis (strain DSM 14884 / JCM 11576 / T1) TaxID=869210 RepID=F2NK76_MARHT|nr:YbaK/EbsC family protein [Marinithermus hydrothermalis]AEB12047.1 YbaK/prolyl-tRNA synthetase associated region [Marinithermus hydrothermalis DSM 14884]